MIIDACVKLFSSVNNIEIGLVNKGCRSFSIASLDNLRKTSPLTPTQPIENMDQVSDGSLWLSQPPKRGGRCLVPYRPVRWRRASAWTRALHAGALATGGFGRSRWGLRRTRAGHIFH